MRKYACLALVLSAACGSQQKPTKSVQGLGQALQGEEHLLANTVQAVAYSGYRKGQHPDRGKGAIEPSQAEILEDLKLLSFQNHFGLIRLYDSGPLAQRTLSLIKEHQLPIRVMLGMWLQAELSNHENCSWLDKPIPESELAKNRLANAAEIRRGIELALKYPQIVIAVNVGNEAIVRWNDHLVPAAKVIEYVKQVKAAVSQPVTVADNYVVWKEHPELGQAVDFAAIHSYPLWEGIDIAEAIARTERDMLEVHQANPGLPLAIGEAGWASVASEFGPRASQEKQAQYYAALMAWAKYHHITVFFFEAFDEPWKGNEQNPLGAEKHWGLFNVQRQPKKVIQALYPHLEAAPLDD